MILAAVDDLFFLSKIQQTARLVGVSLEPIDPKKLQERAAQTKPSGVILDLNHRSGAAVASLRGLKADPSTRGIPVVGFVSHVQGDVIAAAREAGCDEVLARSAFSAQLPQLLKRLVGEQSPDVSARRRDTPL
jgi:CheY-like chemotaxis protein